MARIGLYKYSWKKHRSLIADLAVMSFAVFLAVGAVFGAVKFGAADWARERIAGDDASQEETLRGAAEVAEESTPSPIAKQIKISDLSAQISVSGGGGYAYVGQKDVALFSFELTSPVRVHLKKIRFSVDGYSGSGDLSSLQLYYENKLAGQAPVAGAEAVFERIDIPLEPGRKASFTVKANVGEDAKSGDRVNVGIIGAGDIMLVDEGNAVVTVEADFPLWGGLTSIIGNKVKKLDPADGL